MPHRRSRVRSDLSFLELVSHGRRAPSDRQARLLPGQQSDIMRHGGDCGIYQLSGQLNVLAPEAEGQRWFDLEPRDGFFVPAGAPWQVHNPGSTPAEYLFGVAPRYRPG